jgi:hypothetical protein
VRGSLSCPPRHATRLPLPLHAPRPATSAPSELYVPSRQRPLCAASRQQPATRCAAEPFAQPEEVARELNPLPCQGHCQGASFKQHYPSPSPPIPAPPSPQPPLHAPPGPAQRRVAIAHAAQASSPACAVPERSCRCSWLLQPADVPPLVLTTSSRALSAAISATRAGAALLAKKMLGECGLARAHR